MSKYYYVVVTPKRKIKASDMEVFIYTTKHWAEQQGIRKDGEIIKRILISDLAKLLKK